MYIKGVHWVWGVCSNQTFYENAHLIFKNAEKYLIGSMMLVAYFIQCWHHGWTD